VDNADVFHQGGHGERLVEVVILQRVRHFDLLAGRGRHDELS
jgi:hypothetical protein